MSNHLGFALRQTFGDHSASLAGRILGRVKGRIQRFTAINELEQLTDRQLRDIGVERRQIEEIAAREVAKLHVK